MSEKGNAQNKMVKLYMFQALMILLETKKFQEISITEIVNKAGVSRMAYYRNYNSKEDIFIKYLDDLFDQYVIEMEEIDPLQNKEVSIQFFSYFRRHAVFLENLIKCNLSFILLDQFEKNLKALFVTLPNKSNLNVVSEKYWRHFIAGGLYKMLIEWTCQSMIETDEEMARTLVDLLN